MLPEALSPVLVHIQAHLAEELSLRTLAELAGLSPFHFEREFTSAVGESVKRYTQRLRLERAALRLLLHSSSILDLALECGFQNHETFSRAFRARFGTPPRAYRKVGHLGGPGGRASGGARARTEGGAYQLSSSRICRWRDTHLAFIRHLGPYEEVNPKLWDELVAWLGSRGIGAPHLFLGIGHDAPGLTAPDRLRFDAAIRVAGPMASSGRVGHQVVPEGDFALTTHVGPYSSLPRAYEDVFRQVAALRHVKVIGLPCIEVYHTTRVTATFDVNHTDIYLPVERLRA